MRRTGGQRRGSHAVPSSARLMDFTITSAAPPTFSSGDTYQVRVSESWDRPGVNKTVTYGYSSDATGVCTVSSSGLVTGVGNGTANITITATVDGVLAITHTQAVVCTVVGTPTVASVTLSVSSVSVTIGGATAQVTAYCWDGAGGTGNRVVSEEANTTWTISTGTTNATLDTSTGATVILTAVATGGSPTLTATNNGHSSSAIPITVNAAPSYTLLYEAALDQLPPVAYQDGGGSRTTNRTNPADLRNVASPNHTSSVLTFGGSLAYPPIAVTDASALTGFSAKYDYHQNVSADIACGVTVNLDTAYQKLHARMRCKYPNGTTFFENGPQIMKTIRMWLNGTTICPLVYRKDTSGATAHWHISRDNPLIDASITMPAQEYVSTGGPIGDGNWHYLEWMVDLTNAASRQCHWKVWDDEVLTLDVVVDCAPYTGGMNKVQFGQNWNAGGGYFNATRVDYHDGFKVATDYIGST